MDDAATDSGPVPDRGPQAIRVIWALTPLALITVVLRIVARVRNGKFGWDDIFMILAMLCFLGWSIILTFYAQRGGLRHLEDLKKTGMDNITTVLLLNWICQPFGIIGVGAGKISVSALLLGIINRTGLRWLRLFLWAVTIAMTAILSVACAILTLAQCSPPSALWDKSVHGECIDPHIMGRFGTFVGAFNTFTDASLAIIPTAIFWQLNSTMTEKVQLSIVFGLNILTSICSGIKTQYLANLADRTDLTWATYNIFISVTVELFIMVVCGSVPTLHLILTVFRTATGSAGSKATPHSTRKTGIKTHGLHREVDTELSEMTHMHVKTKTTIERGRIHGSESVDHLVEEKDVPDHGVRVEVRYDVRRDTRSNSEYSKTSA
ncbi:hypothetical protein TOPH_04624 [Tolypocladium ophioglossoides CBS 100239]|uniref:Rhodopsin domain-containing protein n=1 Tax=Tolypocladium ophioglossoides (strain CBS 100239) TaxID=1163406 RepID=A0A0L0N9H7_TOLOC|nr:hypothetical protein TOPH_04624 [Tolypocladium ophioglossoides CBS 100239]